eukprot:6208514-Pleurochrysis_carterae.AAC.1
MRTIVDRRLCRCVLYRLLRQSQVFACLSLACCCVQVQTSAWHVDSLQAALEDGLDGLQEIMLSYKLAQDEKLLQQSMST